ncbi:MAG: PrsW family intramembrane metalloprotease [Chloroflexi bacterium]|nr:PrsW family intramembrane metalloprotease [Chloroflexota bacterium]
MEAKDDRQGRPDIDPGVRREYIYGMNRPWLQILIVGIILFAAAEEALIITRNPAFFPTILLLGSFLVPVVFVAYFYEHVMHREISLPLLTTCFVVGGVLGAVTGGILEYNTLRGLGIFTLLGVGVIEEAVKLLFPVFIYLGWRYRHEADGLLFGLAAGMGFAAVETMGYGMVFLIRSGGDISGLQQLLIIRGFLSPAEHAAWTGFVCAILWREREKTGNITISKSLIGAFVLAVVLHTSWNVVNSLGSLGLRRFSFLIFGNLIIAAVSLSLLFYRYRKAKQALPVADSP